ncbi:ABC transporter ATP-binding protein [Pseudonocardia eucalypti]|uniref:ABC transporter ATP-binding protein n=1 Tax=Pseudonocardia eucalypti TaxID=648755 RepID=A0ABP9Q8H9_9PSEU|nr:peptide/nickel transport system ATP-binding protein [Pseudonocardia eucalypti]
MTEPILQVSDLHVSFPSEAGPVRAVRGVNFEVGAGEVLGIVGESGSGKSVSALATMGLLPPQARTTGSIRFRGEELLGRSDEELAKVRGKRISMVFQDPLSALTPIFTVGDQVAEALRVHGTLGKQEAARRAVELLDVVGIPRAGERSRAFPHEFSGGMRQRVVIAIAIANDPDLIIADEPTTALDVTVQAQVLDVLRTARELTGAGLLLITHDLGVVAGVADRVQVMYAGRVVESAPVDDVFAHPRMPYTLGLLGSIPRLDADRHAPLVPIEGQPPAMVDPDPGCPFEPRCPLAVPQCTHEEPPLETDSQHSAACWRAGELRRNEPDAAEIFGIPTTGEPEASQISTQSGSAWKKATNGAPDVVLRVTDLHKHYPISKGAVIRRRVGTMRAVDGVSFELHAGEVLALVGESGCGKTSTLMEILGLGKPSQGAIEVLGRDVAGLDRGSRRAVRRDLQVVFQDPMAALDPRMPIGDVIAEPLRVHGVPADRQAQRVSELLRLVGLRPEHAERYPAEFSGGQRQRVGIARALALEPKVLVLDEPVSALDVSIQAGVINLLNELKTRLGLAYLFVAHDLSVVRHLADRVAVMYLGKLVESGPVDEVFAAPRHPYTQALLSAIPIPDPAVERRRERILLRGDLPNAAEPPSGCRFRTRCPLYVTLGPLAQQLCTDQEPPHTAPEGAVSPSGAKLGARPEAAPPPRNHLVACHHSRVREVV